MAFNIFMNMEKITLDIVEDHISKMTEDNYEFENYLETEKFTNNIKNGFVIITQLNCYIESFINTIINYCMDYTGEVLLKCSIEEKLDLIFLYYKEELSIIKGNNCWNVYKITTRVRNEMIHFKNSLIGSGITLPDFEIKGQKMGKFFTCSNMKKLKDEHIKLAKMLADSLGLSIYDDINMFEWNGRDELNNYVYDKNKIYVDETRFESGN